ncbi:tRNA (adenine(9)-N1)-methyltransferase [Nanoarchaeota archaeon]
MILEKITSKYINYITVRNYDKNKKYLGQDILVKYLLNKKRIYKDEGKTIYKNFIEVKLNQNAKEMLELDKEKILKDLENEKKFLIDNSLYNLLSNKGKISLKTQITQSLKFIREYLFDTNLILIGDIDYSFLGKNMVKIYKKQEEFNFYKYKAVILDPYGEEVLNDDDLKKYDLFILGGVVDIDLKWYYATQYLFRNINLPHKRIEYKGSIENVPDRINILIKILLDSIYLNIPLEKSIEINSPKKFKLS